ncbi:hypothetical protein D3C85_994830 [compost metagenome]
MQHADGADAVAAVFQAHIVFAHGFGFIVAAVPQQMQQLHRTARRHADRTRGEALQAKVAIVDDGRTFADTADDPARIHGLQHGRQVGIPREIVADDRVFEGGDAALFDQARRRLRRQVVGRFDVDDGRLGQRVREAAHAVGKAGVGIREGHGQQHRRGESARPQDRGLVHHLSVVGPHGRQDPRVRARQSGQHVHDARVLADAHVVEVGIAAIHHVAHAARFQMAEQGLVGRYVQGKVGMAGQGRHGDDRTLQVLGGDRRSFHGRAPG